MFIDLSRFDAHQLAHLARRVRVEMVDRRAYGQPPIAQTAALSAGTVATAMRCVRSATYAQLRAVRAQIVQESALRAMLAGSDCGTGAGGFQPGNDCAAEDGGGGDDYASKPDGARWKDADGIQWEKWTDEDGNTRVEGQQGEHFYDRRDGKLFRNDEEVWYEGGGEFGFKLKDEIGGANYLTESAAANYLPKHIRNELKAKAQKKGQKGRRNWLRRLFNPTRTLKQDNEGY